MTPRIPATTWHSVPAPLACRPMTPKIYTKTGDDGTTGLYYGGRVRKDSAPD